MTTTPHTPFKEDPTKPLKIFKASAGSGKTYTLVQRYLDLLLSPNLLGGYKRILVATFTNKATTELRERIVKELYNISLNGRKEKKGEPEKTPLQLEEDKKRAKAVLEEILLDYESLRVQTIDSFFQEIVRTFVIELKNSSANAEVALDRDGAIEMSVDRLLLQNNNAILDRLGKVLETRVEEDDDTDIRAAIIKLAKEMLYNAQGDTYSIQSLEDRKIDEATVELKEKADNALSMMKQAYNEFQKALEGYSDDLLALSNYGFLKSLRGKELSELIDKKCKEPEKPIYDSRIKRGEDGTLAIFSSKNAPKVAIQSPELMNEIVQIEHTMCQLNGALEQHAREYQLANLLKENLSLIPILSKLQEEIGRYQTEHKVVLIEEINELVKRVINDASTPLIYEKVGGRIDHYMLDEFQDTNRTQWENFKVLLQESLSEMNKNFLVGDVKQSIYRWRGTDSSLLNTEVENDPDFKEYQENIPLDTNWRSDENIVAFNNLFFDKIYDFPLHSKLEGKSNETNKNIYESNVCQTPKQKNGRGYVRFECLADNNTKEEAEELLATRIKELLIQLNKEGYSPGDIAFVVRQNYDAIKIAELLNQFAAENEATRHCFAFLSDEALLVSHSNTVKLIAALFQYVADPRNSQKQIYFDVACYTFGLLDQEKIAQLIEIAQKGTTLFEITNELLAHLEVPREEELYINSFLDLLHQFVETEPNTLLQFSYWWNRIGVNEKVTMGSDENDKIQLITLHKAKGLEFPVVIMPYLNWDISKVTQNSSLEFCSTEYLPKGFVSNSLPFYIIPEAPTQARLNSLIGQKYREIHEANYLDNLNLLYVAFTRPKERLYLFTSEKENTKKVTSIVYDRIKAIKGVTKHTNTDTQVWTFGEAQAKKQASSIDSTKGSEPEKVELHLNKESRQSILKRIESETPFDSQAIQHGIKMHDVMSRVITRDDFEPAIARIDKSDEEKKALTNQFNKAFHEMPELLAYFTPKEGRSILTEQSIYIGESERHKRPDRLVLEGNEATVIDYKFGESDDLPQYHSQIKAYINLLEKMGYNAKGYLWYWERDPQIVEVKK
ncbi:UvrD-helicase domain-containing protein [uncultured Porphyromonas sp.]|uniref:UvrD-helicase domain-containing protein n=1 Tax=uncultured Porphyromonas sp. TaxID=159274 RepID=UPI00261943A2|nr:UvrD-helicase domain-containing protein [uncultured Porphyromonas sp.]